MGCYDSQMSRSYTARNVVDITPLKGKYRSGQAYVTFSHVHEVSKLHIINYTHSQIHVCEYVAREMERLRKIQAACLISIQIV